MKRYNIVLLVDAKGESILICKRVKPPYQGLYNLVGGKAEPGGGRTPSCLPRAA